MISKGKVANLCLLTLFASTFVTQAMGTEKTNTFKKESKLLIEGNVEIGNKNHVDHNCGTDHNGQDWKQLQKELAKQLISKKLKKSKLTRNSSVTPNALSTSAIEGSIAEDGRYYIPLVIHVYGDEYNCADDAAKCLTDEKINDALRKLNNDFQGSSVDSPEILPEFTAIRKNLNIEFVLAKVDPDGNVSKGIVRYPHEQAGYGNNDDATEENISADSWDNFKYMNVYLMHDLHDDEVGNNSGIAWYPDLSMSNTGTARVVYNGHYIGLNTNENFRSVLTHEFGHWLNLIHTFEDKQCSITNEAFCKTTGDRSCDTPQMSLPSQMQNNAMNCLGEPTNTENFMHYTENYAMFTQEQAIRMTAALHGPSRSTLWSNDNLVATGLSEYTSNSDRPWDGQSGLDVEPEGIVLESFDNISAPLDGIETFEVNLPFDATNILFYLDGYTQDPDLYVSSGVVPSSLGDGTDNWLADLFSFNSPGTAESVSIDIPKTNLPYFASVHAYSAFDSAKLQVIQGEDPFLADGDVRYSLFKIDNLWANSVDGMWAGRIGKSHNFQFTVPDDATKVVIVLPGSYQGPKMANGNANYNGDLDLHVSRNKEVSLESYDCRPFSWKAIAEYCEFEGGGTYNVLIDPFHTYTKASIHVYYETANTGNQLPFANTNGSKYEEAVDHAIQFSSEGSNDPDGDIISYLWDFGDGTQSTEPEAVNTYVAEGEYNVTLTVTDNSGETSTGTTKAIITLNSPNDAELCIECTRFYLNDEINLSSIAGDTPKTYQFEVPDDASLVTFELVSRYNGDPDIHVSQNQVVSTEIFDCRPWESAGQTELCQLESGGIFNVMLDPYLDYDSLRFRAYYDIRDDADHSAPNRFPVANAGGDYSGRSNYTVQFNGLQSTDEDGMIAQYLWNFGTGVTQEGAVVQYLYEFPGTYTVGLTVTDNDGAMHTSAVNVAITPVGDMDGDGDVDRNDIRALSLALRRGELLDASFDLNSDGTINSRDTRELRALCSYSRCSSIKPPPQAPVALATSDDTTVPTNTDVQFSSDGSTDQYGRIVSYHWVFGDGNNSELTHPIHAYTVPGIYEVTLTVTDNDGMTASSIIKVNVNHEPLNDACLLNGPDNTGDLIPSEAICMGTTDQLAFGRLNRDHTSVAISLINASSDALIYFGDGSRPRVNTGEYTEVSIAQGQQQCVFYTIPEDANSWGYVKVTGDSEGATIVVDYDVASCRPLAQ